MKLLHALCREKRGAEREGGTDLLDVAYGEVRVSAVEEVVGVRRVERGRAVEVRERVLSESVKQSH